MGAAGPDCRQPANVFEQQRDDGLVGSRSPSSPATRCGGRAGPVASHLAGSGPIETFMRLGLTMLRLEARRAASDGRTGDAAVLAREPRTLHNEDYRRLGEGGTGVGIGRRQVQLVPHLVPAPFAERRDDRVLRWFGLEVRLEAAADLVQTVNSPNVRLQLDQYHAAMAGEDPLECLRTHFPLVAHVQIADVPGRHEPGTGSMPIADFLRELDVLGYAGFVGLEYRPLVDTESSFVWMRTMDWEQN